MAKRFTDTEKWKRPWFRKLSLEARLCWLYLLDNCDHSGIWLIDFDTMSVQIGFEVNHETIKTFLGEKIVIIDEDKMFIPSFINYQYGKLNPDSRPHKSVVKSLLKNKVSEVLVSEFFQKETLSKPLEISFATDKDKEQEQDKEKEKEKEKEQEIQPPDKLAHTKSAAEYDSRFRNAEEISKLKRRLEDSTIHKQLHRHLTQIIDHFGTVEKFEEFCASCESIWNKKKPDISLEQYIVLTTKKLVSRVG